MPETKNKLNTNIEINYFERARTKVYTIIINLTAIIGAVILLILIATNQIASIPTIHILGFMIPFAVIVFNAFVPFKYAMPIVLTVIPFILFLLSCKQNDYGELNYLWLFLILSFYFIDSTLNLILYLFYIFTLIIITQYYWVTNINSLEINILIKSINILATLLFIGLGIIFIKQYSFTQNLEIIEKRLSLKTENESKQVLLNIFKSKLSSSINALGSKINNCPNFENFAVDYPTLKANAEKTYLILDDILFWMKLELNKVPLNKEPIDIHYEIHKNIDKLEAIIDEKDLGLELDMEKWPIVENRNIAEVVIRNLTQFIINTAPKSAIISIALSNKNNEPQLLFKWVSDEPVVNKIDNPDFQIKIMENLVNYLNAKLILEENNNSLSISLQYNY
jgi:hypothetical protein